MLLFRRWRKLLGRFSIKDVCKVTVLFVSLFPPVARAETHPGHHSSRAYQDLAKWKEDVIYELFVDRFYNAVLSNDGEQTGQGAGSFQGGDFQGIIDKLDYLKSLGITTLLLNPIFPSPSYHGYHPTDFFSVNPRYGTLADYARLLAEAHARGMKVLFDLVLNHVAPDCSFFNDHKDWFRNPPETFRAENEAGLFQAKSKISFYGLPDFDHRRKEVRDFLLKVAQFWIDVGVDGFRMDAVTQIEPDFWAWFNGEVKAYAGRNFFIIGEIFEINYFVLNNYTKSFDAMFDFYRYFLFDDVFVNGIRPDYLAQTFAYDKAYDNPKLLLAPILENHDTPRFLSRIREGTFSNLSDEVTLARYLQGFAWMLTNRGVPTLLYGAEIGLTNEPELKHTTWDISRRRMPWLDNEAHPIRAFIRRLLEIRKSYSLGEARRLEVAFQGRVNGYALINEQKQNSPVLVLFNVFPNDSVGEKVSLRFFRELFNGKARFKDLLTGESLEAQDGILSCNMSPFQVRIIAVEPGEK